MLKVVVWGSIIDFDKYSRSFELEILKGNMSIEALIINEEGLFSYVDGVPVFPAEYLLQGNYDYIVNLNVGANLQISKDILKLLQISNDKIISGKVFTLPYFDLQKWHEVKISKVSIMANQCWGGYAYNTLGLEFLSPCINMWFENDGFYNMLSNLKEYMTYEPELKCEQMEPVLNRLYSVVCLGDVEIHMNHYTSFESAKEAWIRRRQRVNYDNIFVHAILGDEKSIESFNKLSYKNKIGFTMLQCDEPGVYSFSNEERTYIKEKYDGNVGNFLNHIVMNPSDECKRFDLLSMLNGDNSFVRGI